MKPPYIVWAGRLAAGAGAYILFWAASGAVRNFIKGIQICTKLRSKLATG